MDKEIEVGSRVRCPIYQTTEGEEYRLEGYLYGTVHELNRIDGDFEGFDIIKSYVLVAGGITRDLKRFPLISVELWEDKDEQRYIPIYPLTIIRDRYDGCYSGGEWLAFKHGAHEIPSSVNGSDTDCGTFWGRDHVRFIYGAGKTIDCAIKNLENKLKLKSK